MLVFFFSFLELLIKGIVGKADGWELFSLFPVSPSPLVHDQTSDITFPRGRSGGGARGKEEVTGQ